VRLPEVSRKLFAQRYFLSMLTGNVVSLSAFLPPTKVKAVRADGNAGAVESVESQKQAALMEQSTVLRGKLTVFSGRIE
jgi:hypothetical protein